MNNFDKFINTSVDERIKDFKTKDDKYWKETGERMALQLFHEASERVPAYKDFLKKHKVNPQLIKTIEDFRNVPLTDKPSYINNYKLKDLCWDGKIETSYFLSSSSGSTGIPNYWPRSTEQTLQGAMISEAIYKEYFQADKKSTLYIVAFAMGMWIAGTYMMMSTDWVAQKGYPITIVTPGLNREEILRLVKVGNENYDQTVLVGYPPFVKDVVDYGIENGLNWKKINIKFLFSGEAFTEKWRAYLKSKTGIENVLTDTINIYGSADVGLVAHETPLTNLLRDLCMKDLDLKADLFNSERIPSANQFNPENRYFEKVHEELVITAPSGLPLVRYNTKDIGDIIYFGEVEEVVSKHNLNLNQVLKEKKIENVVWKNPIVYLFGRGKFTATIYGITLFPEYIKLILDNPALIQLLTGKYVVSTEETLSHDQELHLRVELKETTKKGNLEELIRETFVNELPKISSEYKHLLASMKERVHPIIHLHEYGDPEYFPRGVIKKNA